MTRKQELLLYIQSNPGLTTKQIATNIGREQYTKQLLTELGRELKIYRKNNCWFPTLEAANSEAVRYIRSLRTYGTPEDQKRFREAILRKVPYDQLLSLRDELEALITFIAYPDQIPTISMDDAIFQSPGIEWWFRERSVHSNKSG